MEEVFEPVIEVTEYFDGPRKGVALFCGAPHTFTSRFLDATEYRGDFESVDIFELVPINASPAARPILANARFRQAQSRSTREPGQLRSLEVSWHAFAQAGT